IPDFHVLDITNPSSVTELGSKDLSISNNSSVVGIVVRWPYAFLATSHSTAGFQVWNISNPASIEIISSCGTYNYSEKSTDIDFQNNLGFVTNESNAAL